MSALPERLILLHGAWAGAWVWDGVAERLRAMGWRVEAPDLPGDGAHPIPASAVVAGDYLATLEAAIHAGPGPVALVGHSGGGMLVTAGATACPEAVSHAVWIAGMLIPDGRSFDDIQEEVAGPGRRFGVTPHVRLAPDGRTTTVPPDLAARIFFQDAPPEIAARAASRLTPQPVAGSRIPTCAGPGWADLPKLYVLARRDRSVLPEAQRLMCRGVPRLDVAEIDSDHAPQLTRPGELARILDRWLRGGGVG